MRLLYLCFFAPAVIYRSAVASRYKPGERTRGDVKPQWVRPVLVVDVEFRQRTVDGLRHASFRGIRVEKSVHATR